MIDHIGWVTDSQKTFESFWCDILGFELLRVGSVTSEFTETLFSISGGAKVARYKRPGTDAEIEIHIFDYTEDSHQKFNQFGINHVSITVEDRVSILSNIPLDHIRSYDNPKGWLNVFVTDFEGNWVEIRDANNSKDLPKELEIK